MADLDFDVDTMEFSNSIDELAQESKEADRNAVLENARFFLRHSVQHTKIRTGNLRSAALPVWQHLGLVGRPMTRLEPGEKEVTFTDRASGRRRFARLYSNGTFEDHSRDEGKPYFKFSLFAAEWRGKKRDRGEGKIAQLLRSGLLGAGDLKALYGAMQTNDFKQVWSLIVNLLGSSPAGRSWLLNSAQGYWRSYEHRVAEGQHRTITPKMNLEKEYRKILSRHSRNR